MADFPVTKVGKPAIQSATPLAMPLACTQPGKRRPRCSNPTCPEPGSLFDILRENCGVSLFVLPILWTDAHTSLLRAEFVAQDSIPTPVLPTATSGGPDSFGSGGQQEHRWSKIAEALLKALNSLLSFGDTQLYSKPCAIQIVLSTLFPSTFSRPKTGAKLDVRFGDRVFHSAVCVPVMWKSFDAADPSVTQFVSSLDAAHETDASNGITGGSRGASDGPSIAYVNRSNLDMNRKNSYRIAPGPEDGDHFNTPVSKLHALWLKQLVPSKRDQDAYFLGVFLAMAQAHFYGSMPSRTSSQMFDRAATGNNFHDVKLGIITHDDETSDFIVYTTVVTAAVLRRFAEPMKAVPNAQDQSDTRIELTRVPVWPILGLRERLGKVFGRDLVGDGQEDTDLFNMDEEGADANDSGRRNISMPAPVYVKPRHGKSAQGSYTTSGLAASSKPSGRLSQKRAQGPVGRPGKRHKGS